MQPLEIKTKGETIRSKNKEYDNKDATIKIHIQYIIIYMNLILGRSFNYKSFINFFNSFYKTSKKI